MLTLFSIHENNQVRKAHTSSTSYKRLKSSIIKYISICGAQRGLSHVLGADLFYCFEHVGEVRA